MTAATAATGWATAAAAAAARARAAVAVKGGSSTAARSLCNRCRTRR